MPDDSNVGALADVKSTTNELSGGERTIMNNEPFVENADADYETNADGEQKDPCEKFFKSVRDALKRGAKKAKGQAEKSTPSVKSALGKAVYGISFGAAYGGSFGVTLVKEFIPGTIKKGGSEGLNAGRKAAQRVMKPKPKIDSGSGADDIVVDAEYSVT